MLEGLPDGIIPIGPQGPEDPRIEDLPERVMPLGPKGPEDPRVETRATSCCIHGISCQGGCGGRYKGHKWCWVGRWRGRWDYCTPSDSVDAYYKTCTRVKSKKLCSEPCAESNLNSCD